MVDASKLDNSTLAEHLRRLKTDTVNTLRKALDVEQTSRQYEAEVQEAREGSM